MLNGKWQDGQSVILRCFYNKIVEINWGKGHWLSDANEIRNKFVHCGRKSERNCFYILGNMEHLKNGLGLDSTELRELKQI
jgi:hypothetical protein